jgi:hypothetical protein
MSGGVVEPLVDSYPSQVQSPSPDTNTAIDALCQVLARIVARVAEPDPVEQPMLAPEGGAR